MLVGVHRARIDVEVGVELLQRDLEAAVFEQRAQRGRRQALAQRTDHAAGDKDVFHDVDRVDVDWPNSLATISFNHIYRFHNIRSTRSTSAGTSTPTLS